MKIAQKLAAKAQDLWNAPSVTIAFLGDSVTQGCFELYEKDDGSVETYFDKQSAYHAYIARILSVLYPNVPVNIINAGISGSNAPHGLGRLERDVLRHHPDLTVVCFGLNDCCGGMDALSVYLENLEQIFLRIRESGSEVVFMTPNMMADKLSCHLRPESIREFARDIVRMQVEGVLDRYMEAARQLCQRHSVPVCDCYEKWKLLQRSGVDITELLSNQINHPTREMNWLFAMSLVETMLR